MFFRGRTVIDFGLNLFICSTSYIYITCFWYKHKASQSTPSITSGGNFPWQSNSGSSTVGSRDRSSRSDVSGEQTKWTLDDHCLFMSHSSKNKDKVDTFVQALRGIGVNVWYDKDEIRLGNEWDQKIATDMPNMYGFICCMSKDFFDSDICYRELQVFRNVQKRNKGIPDDSVFPIVIDPQSFDGVKQNWQMQLPPQTHYKKWPDDKYAILQNLETFVKNVKKGIKRPPQHGSSSLKKKEPSSDSEESAPVPSPSEVRVSSNPEERSYSHVRAADVLQTFYWCAFKKELEAMLTESRVYTLERRYKLIDSPCKTEIKSVLAQRNYLAATRLVQYFEANHNGDDLLRFCKFLRDEAEEAGGSAELERLADKIEKAVKDLGASGST